MPGPSLGLAPGREFDLIRRFFPAGLPGPRPDVLLGPGDDCAVVTGAGIALSSDMSVEGVHFRREWITLREIGYRATAAALSDLAAVAARPIGVLVSLALPEVDAGGSAEQLMAGAGEAIAHVGGIVLGGDVTRSPGPLVVDVTAVGEAARPLTRSGARPGDEVWVTGELGGSGAAVAAWLAGQAPDPAARRRFATPAPRTAEALWLAERDIPTAMLDLSDGIGGDAGHVAAASRVAVILNLHSLPVHAAAQGGSGAEAVRLALRGGEDYELMFTAGPGTVDPLRERFASRFDIPLTRVGRVEAGAGVYRQEGDTILPLTDGGFQHFEG